MSDLDNPEMSNSYSAMSVEWKEIATKAALCGVLAGAASAVLIPGGAVTLAGMQVPGSVAIGLACAGGSVTGDLAHKYILPYIPQSQKYAGIESSAVSIGGAMVGAYFVMNAMGDVPVATPLILGGGAYVGADYLYFRVFNSQTGGFIY